AIVLDGTYHNLALFFDRMSRFSRIINVEEMKINSVNEVGKSIAASFVAKTFIYTEEKAAAPTKKGAAPAGGGVAAKAQAIKKKAGRGVAEGAGACGRPGARPGRRRPGPRPPGRRPRRLQRRRRLRPRRPPRPPRLPRQPRRATPRGRT